MKVKNNPKAVDSLKLFCDLVEELTLCTNDVHKRVLQHQIYRCLDQMREELAKKEAKK